MKKIIVAPSLLSADFSCLRRSVELIEQSPAQWLHWDVMDGKFVPNITFGMPVIKALRPFSRKFFDVHLMIEDPDRYVEDFVRAGADMVTVHYEATTHLHRTVQHIKNAGAKAGVALNPATPAVCVEDILPYVDLILIMSVNPGFGGQSFIHGITDKIRRLHAWKKEYNPRLLIEVDGGINEKTAVAAAEAGADVLVAGSFVFGSSDPIRAVELLLEVTS